MSVFAKIKFTQLPSYDPPAGEALVGDAGLEVVCSNENNSNVETFSWEVIDAPPGSVVPLGVVAYGNVTTFSFVPDLPGGYHVHLTTIDLAGNKAEDFRVFQVPEPSGYLIPPFDAEAPALNFAGQKRGWAKPIEELLRFLLSGGSSGNWPTVGVGTGSSPYTPPPGIIGIRCSTDGNYMVVQLPPGTSGRPIAVWDGNGGAGSPTQYITILPDGSETIGGESSYVIDVDYGGVLMIWFQNNWAIIGSSRTGGAGGPLGLLPRAVADMFVGMSTGGVDAVGPKYGQLETRKNFVPRLTGAREFRQLIFDPSTIGSPDQAGQNFWMLADSYVLRYDTNGAVVTPISFGDFGYYTSQYGVPAKQSMAVQPGTIGFNPDDPSYVAGKLFVLDGIYGLMRISSTNEASAIEKFAPIGALSTTPGNYEKGRVLWDEENNVLLIFEVDFDCEGFIVVNPETLAATPIIISNYSAHVGPGFKLVGTTYGARGAVDGHVYLLYANGDDGTAVLARYDRTTNAILTSHAYPASIGIGSGNGGRLEYDEWNNYVYWVDSTGRIHRHNQNLSTHTTFLPTLVAYAGYWSIDFTAGERMVLFDFDTDHYVVKLIDLTGAMSDSGGSYNLGEPTDPYVVPNNGVPDIVACEYHPTASQWWALDRTNGLAHRIEFSGLVGSSLPLRLGAEYEWASPLSRRPKLISTTPYNATMGDDFVVVDASAGPKTYFLPTVDASPSTNEGFRTTIKLTPGSLYPVSVWGTGGQYIDGNPGTVLREPGSSMSFVFDLVGNRWWRDPGTAILPARRTLTDADTLLCWKLDESGAPFGSTGSNALSLTVPLGTVTAEYPGIFNSGVLFELGVSATGVLGSGNTSVNPALQAFTVSCWVKLTAFNGSGIFVAKAYRNDGTYNAPFNSFQLSQGPTPDGSWSMGITVGGTRTLTTITASKIISNQWMHVAMTWDGNDMRGYLNGQLAAKTNIAFGPNNVDFGTNGPYNVGNTGHATAGGNNGVIDDVRIESVVRSGAYLAALYKKGIGLFD